MKVIAISTSTSLHMNENNGNLKTLFQSIVKDRDNCNIVIDLLGKELSIPVVNGLVVSNVIETSIRNLLKLTLGTIPYHLNPS